MSEILDAGIPSRNLEIQKSHSVQWAAFYRSECKRIESEARFESDTRLTADELQRLNQWNAEYHRECEQARREYNAARRRMRALGLM